MYVFICMYVRMSCCQIHTFKYIYIYTYTYIYIYIYIYVCMYMCVGDACEVVEFYASLKFPAEKFRHLFVLYSRHFLFYLCSTTDIGNKHFVIYIYIHTHENTQICMFVCSI